MKTNLTTYDKIFSISVCVLIRNPIGARHDHKGQRSGHHRQDIADVVYRFAAHFHAVHLQHFVAFVEQSALFGCATPHYPADDHRVAVVSNSSALYIHTSIDKKKKNNTR